MSAYSEEQKLFINDMRINNKTIKEIQSAFSEKYNRVPAPVTITKYGNYHKWGRKDTPDTDVETPEIPKDEPKKEEKEGETLEVKVKDTRKEKKPKDDIIDFSSGQMSEADFNRIVALRGGDQSDTFNFLKKCVQNGYAKINMKTGEITQ